MVDKFVSRLLAQAAPDDFLTQAPQRVGRYQDLYQLSPLLPRQVAADEGSYWCITNVTPGTGISLAANVTSFSDTNALIVLQNQDSPANPLGKSAYLDKLVLIQTGTAPTGTLGMHFAVRKGTTNRRASTPTTETEHTPVNMRKVTGRVPSLRVFVFNASGAYTVPASVASVDFLMLRCVLPTGVHVLGDEYFVNFGSDDFETWQGGAAARATDPARHGITTAPVVVDPGEFAVIHMWWVTAGANTAAFEYQLGWMER